MPGLVGTDLPAASGFKLVRDPYTGAELYAIPALKPDWAVIHVHEADQAGNARIFGSPGYDLVMIEAADRVILTAERIVPTSEFQKLPELTQVPSFVVTAVVHAPEGAWPTGCHPDYDVDEAAVRAYRAEVGDAAGLARHLAAVGR
jgi:glutaconate CoA-transferase subunit A